MTQALADRNLLFGILALQMDFVSRDNLVAAMNFWVLDKRRLLAQVLEDQGALTPDTRTLLDVLVDRHVKLHGGDPARSLQGLSSLAAVREDLAGIADQDVQASLAQRGAGPETRATLHTRVPEMDQHATRQPSAGTDTAAGRFYILRPHARGGLGEVFVAQDTELEREVALKEIQERHAGHADNRARFLAEARVTGALEHPSIVPVYGLGHHADGRPYYAMRFIRGESLQDAIDRFHAGDSSGRDPGERTLAFRELLRRFQDVCNAIAFAHSRGILHRDLKPANIMLGKFGETLVVDWGLAKQMSAAEACALDSSLPPMAGSSSTATRMGQLVGTPGYMSPEQAEGRLDLLGASSDVYSLGATLYCVLTGQPPSHGEKDLGKLLERVRRGEFPRPRRLNAAVPPALEAICLKAMALKPGERYATPRHLADDLEHWLADEPVAVFREPVAARLGRWARRHRPLVAGATALLLTATTALGVGFVLVRQEQEQTERQRAEAVAAREEADQNARAAEDARRRADASATVAHKQAQLALETLKSVVFDIQGGMKDKPGLQGLREKLLKTALDGLQAVARDGAAIAAEADRQTAVALNDLGDIFLELGHTQEARGPYLSALTVAEHLAQAEPANVLAQRDLSVSHNKLGDMKLRLGDVPGAREAYEKALAIRERLAAAMPGNPNVARDLSISYERLGEVGLTRGDTAAALDSYRKGLALRERLATADPTNATAQRDLSVAYDNLGDVSLKMGDPAAAGEAYQKSLVLRERLARADPTNTQARRDLCIAYDNVADVSLKRVEVAKSREAYQKSLALRMRLTEADPANTYAQRELTISFEKLGDVDYVLGNAASSRENYRKALEVRERLAQADQTNTQAQRDLSVAYSKQGFLRLKQGDAAGARDAYQKADAIRERLALADPANAEAQRDLAIARERLGDAALELGDSAQARGCYLKALGQRERLAQADPANVQARLDLVVCYSRLASLERGLLAHAEAARWLERSLKELDRLNQEGKLKGQAQYAGWFKSLRGDLSFSKSAEQAIHDQAFALAQPPEVVPQLLAARVRALGKRGDHAEAARSAGEFLKRAGKDPEKLYQAALLFAACAAAVEPDKKTEALSAETRDLRENYATRAISALREAIAHGFNDRARLKSTKDLDLLRNREDFQKLLGELKERKE